MGSLPRCIGVSPAGAGERPASAKIRGQDAHAPEIVKINLLQFPTGRKFAGIYLESGHQVASLQYGGQLPDEITQWESVSVVSGPVL